MTDYADMTKDELMAEADKRGVDSSGTKAEITARLEAAPSTPTGDTKTYASEKKAAADADADKPAADVAAAGAGGGEMYPGGSVVNAPDPGTSVAANIQGATEK